MAAEEKHDLSCPEALYYADCPTWKKKKCDAINCWTRVTWRERERIEKERARNGS